MAESLTPGQYLDWWISLPDGYDTLDEPVRTLVHHVQALQARIDLLPDHDECAQFDHNCCCGYDHPDDICMAHAARRRSSG